MSKLKFIWAKYTVIWKTRKRADVRDYTTAVLWYTKATEQEYAEAQNNLGDMYYYGQGVAQDYNKAIE